MLSESDTLSFRLTIIREMSAAHAAQCHLIDTLRRELRVKDAEIARLRGDSTLMDAIIAEQYPELDQEPD